MVRAWRTAPSLAPIRNPPETVSRSQASTREGRARVSLLLYNYSCSHYTTSHQVAHQLYQCQGNGDNPACLCVLAIDDLPRP